ncbi:MAG: A/G-specific adenine glycosylase [Gaiellales bacterium]
MTIDALQADLLAWFSENGRELPWRKTRDPYAILVSEVMLQQTQVPRVIERWTAWLEQWPTVEALASASTADVVRAWSGLGYNRRAINLQRTARAVAEAGAFPRTVPELLLLPGVGPYTASAIACFAFGVQLTTVDVNARRVLGRALGVGDAPPPPRRAWEWNQALFDLGATTCLARVPRCERCPLSARCPSRGMRFEPARKQGPFAGSNRARRAALVRELHAGPQDVRLYDPAIVEGLQRDGLLVIRDGLVALPEEAIR